MRGFNQGLSLPPTFVEVKFITLNVPFSETVDDHDIYLELLLLATALKLYVPGFLGIGISQTAHPGWTLLII
jgi:hypothetical protein